MNKLLVTMLATMTVASVIAVPGSVKTLTSQVSGDVKWQRSSKSYVITHKKNKATVNTEIPLGEVELLNIDKPANFDKLVDMVRRGQGANAIAPLQAMIDEYRMLQWDKPACRYLVEAHISANNPQKAYDVATRVIADDKSAAWSGDLAPAYWQALLKLGKNSQLENCLRKASSSGDRASSASALVMRGDMILATVGDTPDGFRKALTDAYLRVALMYTDPPCRDARILSMQKAAACFDKLGMAARAESMRTQAKTL